MAAHIVLSWEPLTVSCITEVITMRDRSRDTLERLLERAGHDQALALTLPSLHLGDRKLYVVGYSTPRGHELHRSKAKILVLSANRHDEKYQDFNSHKDEVHVVVLRDATTRPWTWTILEPSPDEGFKQTLFSTELTCV